jgi:hypothetical protein
MRGRGTASLGVRWHIGERTSRTYLALRLSILGAWQAFGDSADYAVTVDTLDVAEAQRRVGTLTAPVRWHAVDGLLPDMIQERFDPGLADGTAWKLAPVRVFPDLPELSLEPDCILWSIPPAVRGWLSDAENSFLLADDVRPRFGKFWAFCGGELKSARILGLPPGFDFDAAMAQILDATRGTLSSELEVNGLQVAAVTDSGQAHVVSSEDVSICSPFSPDWPHLGRFGAQFMRLEPRRVDFHHEGRPAIDVAAEHFDAHVLTVAAAVGLRQPHLADGSPLY